MNGKYSLNKGNMVGCGSSLTLQRNLGSHSPVTVSEDFAPNELHGVLDGTVGLNPACIY